MAKSKPPEKPSPKPRRRFTGGTPTELTEERERKAWEMRCQNYTQTEIGKALGVHHTTISRALDRIRKREYVEFAKAREQHKIDQTRQLEYLGSQAMRAWEKSKEPQTRARETTNADGEKVIVQEAVEREGNTAYLYVVLKCMDEIRKVWGLDVLPATQDVGSSLAGMIRDLDERAKRYEAEVKADHTGGTAAAAAPRAEGVPE